MLDLAPKKNDFGVACLPVLGREWIVDGTECEAALLRSEDAVRALLARAMKELSLNAVAPPLVHKFPGEGGVTALVLLSESHLAVHTFPEHGALTLNVYCCKERPTWDFQAVLGELFQAKGVRVTAIARGTIGHDSPPPSMPDPTEPDEFGERPTRQMSILEAHTRGQK